MPNGIEQATEYVDRLADTFVVAAEPPGDMLIPAKRNYIGGLILLDDIAGGHRHYSDDLFPLYNRHKDGPMVSERLNGLYTQRLAPVIQSHGTAAAKNLRNHAEANYTDREWRNITRLFAANIFEAGKRKCGVFEPIDILESLATGRNYILGPGGSE